MGERPTANQEFEQASQRYHGRILKGQYAHWCEDWDGLPIDETCVEFCVCTCYDFAAVADIQAGLRAQMDAENEKLSDDLTLPAGSGE